MPDGSKGYVALPHPDVTLSLTVFQSLVAGAHLCMTHQVHNFKLEENWWDFKTGNHWHLLGARPCKHCRLLFQPALPFSPIIIHEITPATLHKNSGTESMETI